MNKITKENITANMLVKMEAFNDESVALTGSTIHSEVLSTNDGFKGVASSAPLYKGAIDWTIWANGGTKVKWPGDWLDKSVDEMADFIISKQKYE